MMASGRAWEMLPEPETGAGVLSGFCGPAVGDVNNE